MVHLAALGEGYRFMAVNWHEVTDRLVHSCDQEKDLRNLQRDRETSVSRI
jgi:hypothetical protein